MITLRKARGTYASPGGRLRIPFIVGPKVRLVVLIKQWEASAP